MRFFLQLLVTGVALGSIYAVKDFYQIDPALVSAPEDTDLSALVSLGYQGVADNLAAAGEAIQKLRWRLRLRTGCDPMRAKIPKRYTEVVTWKGPIDTAYMEELRQAYATRLLELGREEGL